MPSRSVCLALVLPVLATADVAAQSLKVGDPAPPVLVSQWIKGGRIDRFDRGTTYVVVFWATWSRECRDCLPLLTGVQKRFKAYRVQFVGIDVWEQNPDGLAAWVVANGKEMDYPLGLDFDGRMRSSWVEASGRRAVPSVFIVRDGKVAWFGPPDELGPALEPLMPKEYHLAVAIEKRKEKVRLERKYWTLSRKVKPLVEASEFNEALAVIDTAVSADPNLESLAGPLKYKTLIEARRPKEASSYGNTLVETAMKDDVDGLFELTSWIVDRAGTRAPSARDLKLARKAAERANELAGSENAGVLDVLAEIYAAAGEFDYAVEAEEEAVRLTERKNPKMLDRLSKYKAGANPPR